MQLSYFNFACASPSEYWRGCSHLTPCKEYLVFPLAQFLPVSDPKEMVEFQTTEQFKHKTIGCFHDNQHPPWNTPKHIISYANIFNY